MSKPIKVINALYEKLKQINNVLVLKNEPLPQKIPKNGIIFIRDGDLGEPEVLLSPLIHIYKHQAEIEVVVQASNSTQRDNALDVLLMRVNEFVNDSVNLGGLVDYISIGTPEFLLEDPEGTVPIKAAIIPVILEYSTQNILM